MKRNIAILLIITGMSAQLFSMAGADTPDIVYDICRIRAQVDPSIQCVRQQDLVNAMMQPIPAGPLTTVLKEKAAPYFTPEEAQRYEDLAAHDSQRRELISTVLRRLPEIVQKCQEAQKPVYNFVQNSVNNSSTLQEITEKFVGSAYFNNYYVPTCPYNNTFCSVLKLPVNAQKIASLFETDLKKKVESVYLDCTKNSKSFRCLCPELYNNLTMHIINTEIAQRMNAKIDPLVKSLFKGGAQDKLKEISDFLSYPLGYDPQRATFSPYIASDKVVSACTIDAGNTGSYSVGQNSFAHAVWRTFNLLNNCTMLQPYSNAIKQGFCKFVQSDSAHHKEFIDRWKQNAPNEKQWFDKFEQEWCPGVLTTVKNQRDARDKAATVTDKLAQTIFEGGAQDLLKTVPGAQACTIEQGNAQSYKAGAGTNSLANAIWRAFNLINSCGLFK